MGAVASGIRRGQDQTVPTDHADLPFTFNVESAFRLTGRGTVIVGVIEQGSVQIGNQLELIQPRRAVLSKSRGASGARRRLDVATGRLEPAPCSNEPTRAIFDESPNRRASPACRLIIEATYPL